MQKSGGRYAAKQSVGTSPSRMISSAMSAMQWIGRSVTMVFVAMTHRGPSGALTARDDPIRVETPCSDLCWRGWLDDL
jgi:hypothetical protein